MRVIKPLRLGILHRAYPFGGKTQLGIAILAMVPMRGPRELGTEMAMWTAVAERLGPSGILDEGYVKARGEVLVRGSCHAPGGDPVTETFCRVKVGDSIDAAVRVTGDRVWLGDEPSKPRPFRSMPLDDAHALGGEDDLENPFGKGLVPVQTEHGELHPLPNIEDPAQPMRSPKDRPLPAGLGPVFLGSPSRRDLAGTYDERWLETRFPGVAEDASPDLFQMARPAQRLRAGFFRGGERVSVWNMHPEHALVECDVPDLVARAFVRRHGSEALEPVAMHLETLHLFPDALMLVALYRGAVAVAQSDASDIDLLAIGDAALLSITRLRIGVDAGESLAGLDFTGADLRGVDLTGLDLRGILLESARLDDAKLDDADLTGAVLCRASLTGASFRGAKLHDANLGDTDFRGAVFDGAELRQATLMRSRLDGASFRGADLTGALLLEASFGAVDLEGAFLEKVTFLRVDLRGTRLAGASMTQAQLVECDASGVSFEGATLKSTVWIDTKAVGARFVDANMTQAALSKGIDATEANFSGATLDRGSLRGATMPRARFVGARLRFADLSEARAAGARFDHADARGMLAIRIDLRGGSMRSASFMDTLLTGADLRGVDATDVVLFQAGLAGIATDGATKLDGAILTRSNTRPRREAAPSDAPDTTPTVKA